LVSGSLSTPRQFHSAALLNDDRVLIVGGVVGANTVLSSAEIYDPQTQTFTPANGNLQTPRGLALLRVLHDGKVQVLGGDGEFSMEMFDPATNSFIALAHIPPHDDYLSNILVSRTRSALITTIIQQNPVLQGKPELTPEIIALLNRLDHTVTEIPQSNRAVIAGGINDAGQILSSATVVSSSAATITTDRFDYSPGEIVTITGQGWQPNETVWMLLHEEPETHEDVITSSVADNQGNFTNTDFAPATADAYRTFTLTAIGQTSGFATQTAFKDSPKVGSVSVSAQTGTATYGTATTSPHLTYTITVNRGTGPGSSGAFTATLSVTGALPAGASASFSPNPVSFAAANASKTATLTISTTASTPVGATSFTVKAATSASDFATGNGTLTVNKASATVVLSNLTQSYTGSALMPTATTTPAGLAIIWTNAPQTNPGSYSVTATVNDANYEGSASGTFTVNKVDPSCTVNGYTGTYDGAAHGATGSCTGVDGTTVLAGLNLGLSFTNVPGGTANWTFTDVTGNYKDKSGSVAIVINKAGSTTTVTCPPSVNYNGAAQTPCSATATGAGGLSQSLTVIYLNNINAGTATANASFAGDTNHDGSSDSKNFTIDKAASVTTVTCPTNVTYTGSAIEPCTATVTGAGGLNQSLTVNYTNNINAGTATASASFPGDANHNGSGDTKTFVINKAPVTATAGSGSATYDGATKSPSACTVTGAYTGDLTCANDPASVGPGAGTTTIAPVVGGTGLSNFDITSVNGSYTIDKAPSSTVVSFEAGPYTYRGTSFTATAVVTGAGELNELVAVAYSGDCTNVTVMNGCTATATFGGDANHKESSDTKSITINKANANCTVNGYAGTYDGTGHGATGSCTGVGGVTLSGVNLGASFTNVPGGTAYWTFSGGTNYNDKSGSVEIVINKADATIHVYSYTGAYDGTPHGASGTATGVLGENLNTSLNLGATFIGVPGGTAHWTFNGGTNYKNVSGDVAIVIERRNASVTPHPASKVLGTPDPVPLTTGTLIGFLDADNVTATYSRTLGETVAGNPYIIGATVDAAPGVLNNYNVTSNTANFTIQYAPAGFACYGAAGHQILQPINTDGASIFKKGSTVPAKFRVCDGLGNSIGILGVVSQFRLEMIYNGTTGDDVAEAVVSTTPDTAFRWSSSDQQWIFNINTKNLSANRTYEYRITLNDGSYIDFRYGLK
jgi:hypothetical protein